MNMTIDRRNALTWIVGGGTLLWVFLRSRTSYEVPEISVAEARSRMDAGAMVIDVRTKDAFDARHLPMAVLIPLAVLRAGIPQSLVEARTRQIVVYCGDGVSTGPEATHILVQAGFTQVANMTAGIEGWAAAGMQIGKA